jgi:hypothetical protein
MAWVTSFESKFGEGKIQPTQLVAYVKEFETEGRTKVLQIDTFGSADREHPKKQSQTLQFGEDAARQLFEIISRTYGFKTDIL